MPRPKSGPDTFSGRRRSSRPAAAGRTPDHLVRSVPAESVYLVVTLVFFTDYSVRLN
jgi:hypothetical protein